MFIFQAYTLPVVSMLCGCCLFKLGKPLPRVTQFHLALFFYSWYLLKTGRSDHSKFGISSLHFDVCFFLRDHLWSLLLLLLKISLFSNTKKLPADLATTQTAKS